DPLLRRDPPAQFLVPAGDVAVQVVQPQGQVDLPAVRELRGQGDVIPLVADLAGHAPGTPFVAVVQAGDLGPGHDPRQQGHDVRGREIRADQDHYVYLRPAHQPGDEA